MDVETVYEDGSATISVSGHLNTNTAGDLEREFSQVLSRCQTVILDFQELVYLSSAGLRVLVAAQKQVSASGGTMRIANLTDEVREVFEITGLIDVLDVE